MYAQVLIEYTNKALDKSFTYIIPKEMRNTLKVGMKVKVPFNNRIINGFVVDITAKFAWTSQHFTETHCTLLNMMKEISPWPGIVIRYVPIGVDAIKSPIVMSYLSGILVYL